MGIDKWPADNPDAKDPLERHNYERCLVDSAYAEEHSGWFKYASRERARRVMAAAAAERQAEVNRSRLTAFEAQVRAEREEATRRADTRSARTAAATERLARNARKW